jgi:superfamily II DNA helicase RecQ
MNYRVFQYPLPAPAELEDLNSYLAGHRVAGVTQYLAAGGSMLVFVVETVAAAAGAPFGGRSKIDYRAELSEEDFAVFSRLRSWRKGAAEAEGVPVYTLFTNAQLAAMARRRVASLGDLQEIEGIGAARVEKYGAALLAILASSSPSDEVAAAQGAELRRLPP